MKKVTLFAIVVVLLGMSLFAKTKAKTVFNGPSTGLAPRHEFVNPTNRVPATANLNRDPDYQAYGYNALDPQGPVTFVLNDPAGVTTLAATTSGDFIAAATMVVDTWIGCEYGTGNFYTIDFDGTMTFIGGNGTACNALAYDDVSGTLYGATYNGTTCDLYTIDPVTGNGTMVGTINSGIIIGMACDGAGNLYGVDIVDDNLYSIESATGAGSVIGSLGIDLNYAQDAEFDKDDNVMYLAAYTDGPYIYSCDVTTGATTLVGAFPTGMEITAFAIPYTLAEDNSPAAPSDFTVTPDAGGALQVTLNWTNPSETYDGNPLTALDEMRVYRDGELIYTETNPTIGVSDSYVDNVPTSDEYSYSVVGYNEFGEGPAAGSGAVWIGEDVPAAVTLLTLTDASTRDLAGQLTWVNPISGLHNGPFNEAIQGYHIIRSDGETFEVTGETTEYLDNTIPGGNYYSYEVIPYNSVGDGGSAISNTEWIGEAFSGILIIDLDPTPTGATLQAAIQDIYGGTVGLATSIDEYPITSNIDAIFLLVGIYSSNHQLTEEEVGPLVNYLNTGGNLYLEGGDTWGWDTPTTLHGYFNVDGVADGASDLANVLGADFLDGMSWTYSGENHWIDHLEPLGDATVIFTNPDVSYNCGIANDAGTYKTVGTSFEITGLGGTNTLEDALVGILDFFGFGDQGNVDGIVTDSETGTPIAGADVWIGNNSVSTDASGYYLLEGIPTGSRDIYSNADGYYLFEGSVDVVLDETTTYDIALDPNAYGSIDGTVTDADSGDPLVGATIHAVNEEQGYDYETTTDGSGYYIINDVISETYDVICSFPNYPTTTEHNVVVNDNETTTVDFDLAGYTYFSDFETDDGGLVSDNPNGWQWGIPANGPAEAWSGEKLWGTNITADYEVSANWILDTPTSYQLGAGDNFLEFEQWYDIETTWDGGNVKISTDDGATWTVITPEAGYPVDAANDANAGIPGEPCFSGHLGQWEHVVFNLSDYAGQVVKFRWQFGSDASVTYPGWFIDDVSLSGGAPPEHGDLEGFVTEAGTGNPIEGAHVTLGQFTGITDASGYYSITSIIAMTYNVTCTAEGYFDSVENGFEIQPDVVNNLDFELTWAEIDTDPTSFDVSVPQNNTLDANLSIINNGPGELSYNISISEVDLLTTSDENIHISIPAVTELNFDNVRVNPKKYDLYNLSGNSSFEQVVPRGIAVNRDRNVSVLILCPDDEGASGQLQTALQAFGDLDVSLFPTANLGTITLADLTPYNVVVAYNDLTWENAGSTAAAIGDLLADYIDAGGKVVDNMYLHSFDQWGLSGRYITEQYSPFTSATTDNWSPTNIGTIYEPDHPILAGVGDVGQTWGVQDPGVADGAVRIADWDDGNVFIAANENVVGLNNMPVDPNSGPTWTGDMPTIYHNAILWIGSPINWITVNPSSGTVAGGSSIDVTVTFDPSGLAVGSINQADIIISNNAITGENYIVPVTLTVDPASAENGEVDQFSTALGLSVPNPFIQSTRINFSLNKEDKISLDIYNVKGQKVKTLVNNTMEAGNHQIIWDGTDSSNRKVSSGIYFYKMKSGKFTSAKKMILMK